MAVKEAPRKRKRRIVGQGKEESRGNAVNHLLKQGELHLRHIVEAVITHMPQRREESRRRKRISERFGEIVRSPDVEAGAGLLNGRLKREEPAEPFPILVPEAPLLERLQRGGRIHAPVFQVADRRPERAARSRRMSEPPQRRQFMRPSFDQVADQIFEEEVVDEAETNVMRTASLVRQSKGELMEGQEMKIEERQAAFDRQYPANAVQNRLRGYDDGDGGPGVASFDPLDVFDERGFE